ncbi:hypothetical protein FJT64_013689 [Amphibalanus amphitrite]|uniref:Protein sleepless n=1 Tax=Amphibalanus amphitrite TaxID=1232801 RepID=A0A6A4V217_AMPAM|nr:hypothetical protein FJT64_013689 [Amphibalanus amphitrite]
MSRRPLVPLLALAALLALPPAVRGLKCFTCSDPAPIETGRLAAGTNGSVVSALLSSLSNADGLPSCSNFDSSNCEMKLYACLWPSDSSCVKAVHKGVTYARGCSQNKPVRDECLTSGDHTTCVCTGDYCNSAGLSTPALLLLLPAALLAALHTRQ